MDLVRLYLRNIPAGCQTSAFRALYFHLGKNGSSKYILPIHQISDVIFYHRGVLTVIRKCADHAYNKPPTADRLGASAWAIVSVLPEHTGVFLMYADHVFDDDGTSVMSDVSPRLLRS